MRSPGATHRNIYVRSERAGQRVMESITRFLTQKLQLKVNEAKSAVARPQERKFLGFSFTKGPEVKRAIAPKALERFKKRVRDITRRAKGVSIEVDDGRTDSVSTGLARLFRFLRNAQSVDWLDPLGSSAASGCSVAAMENSTPSPCRFVGTGGPSTAGA